MDSEHEVNNMQGREGGEGDDVLVEGMQVDDDDNGGGFGGSGGSGGEQTQSHP